MWRSVEKYRRLLADNSGNIAISAALTSPLIAIALALGVDVGFLSMQRREAQQTADLAAISAATDITNAEKVVLQHFRINNLNLAVRTPSGFLIDSTNPVALDEDKIFESKDGYATVMKGTYVPDPSIEAGKRFVEGATPANAVQVAITEKGKLYFGGAFTTPPMLTARGTASSTRIAAFSVGSRLASVDGGMLNALLGGLLGTTVSLKAVDYNALLTTDVNALRVIDALALNLGIKAGTYKDVLGTEIGYGQLLDAIAKTTGLKPSVVTIISNLQKTVNKTQARLRLDEVLNLKPYEDRLIGAGDTLAVTASVFDLINAAAVAANGSKQIDINLGATVPGLATTTLKLAIGEPPVGTPPLAVGAPGTIVRTAQVRVALEVGLDGLAAIAGLRLKVPLYVEVANAEARLSGISCNASGQGSVSVEAVPGVAEIALGEVNAVAFNNFGTTPRVTKADILDSALLKISALGHVDIANLKKTTLTFSQTDITNGTVKTVSTKDTVTSLVQSLLKNLDLEIKLLFLSLGSPTAVQVALADTLSLITAPLDTVLYNVLLTLGVRVGEADVRVTDVRCMPVALVL